MSASLAAALAGPLRNPLPALFTDDADVRRVTSGVLPLVATYVSINCVTSGCLNSILRGIGLVRVPCLVNFAAFYLAGIPFGALAAFRIGWGIYGLWAGLCVSIATMAAGLSLYLRRFDWQAAAAVAQARSAPLGGDAALREIHASQWPAEGEEEEEEAVVVEEDEWTGPPSASPSGGAGSESGGDERCAERVQRVPISP